MLFIDELPSHLLVAFKYKKRFSKDSRRICSIHRSTSKSTDPPSIGVEDLCLAWLVP